MAELVFRRGIRLRSWGSLEQVGMNYGRAVVPGGGGFLLRVSWFQRWA